MENYIAELIETLPQLDGLDKSFHSFYVCTAVRKFFFFLDPLRTGKIKIQDILASSFLDDLLELRDQDLAKDAQDANWFSAPSALRVYGQYLNLDKDHNGMLSRQVCIYFYLVLQKCLFTNILIHSLLDKRQMLRLFFLKTSIQISKKKRSSY